MKKKYRVIFFVPVERFFVTMIPVILKYTENERLVVKTFFWESPRKLQDNKIFYTELYGYKLYDIFRWHTKNFLKRIKEEINNSGFYKKVFIKDIFIGGLLNQIFKKLIYENFPEKMRDIDLIRKVILTYKPKVVVVGGNSTETIRIVKSLSMPIVTLQSIHPVDFVFFGPLLADAVTVDGSYWKHYLVERNVTPEKIWITGSPKFDFLYNKRFALPGAIPMGKFSESGKMVIFATNYSSVAMGSLRYQNIERIKNVCRVLRNIKEAHLIIKLHPFDNDFSLYKNIAKEAGLINYTIQKNVEILNLLQNCDLLITHISAVSYEAVLMDKNVILLVSHNDFQMDDNWDFTRYNAAIIVDSFTELEDSIRKILFDSETKSILKRNREGYIYEHAYKMDGDASGRVKEVINRFV